jgi:hypothetical protein
MTGKNKKQLVYENLVAVKIFKENGIRVLSPVIEEGILPDDELLSPLSAKELEKQWYNDKKLIKKAHVLVDLSGFSNSEGVHHEIGLARYGLFKPIVRIHPSLGISVARLEDDMIVRDVEEAARVIVDRWGSRWKRICWRVERNLFFKWIKLIFLQFREFFR